MHIVICGWSAPTPPLYGDLPQLWCTWCGDGDLHQQSMVICTTRVWCMVICTSTTLVCSSVASCPTLTHLSFSLESRCLQFWFSAQRSSVEEAEFPVCPTLWRQGTLWAWPFTCRRPASHPPFNPNKLQHLNASNLNDLKPCNVHLGFSLAFEHEMEFPKEENKLSEHWLVC